MHAVTLNTFDVAAILIVATALLAYLNHRVFGLPPSVAMTAMGAVASLVVVSIDLILPTSNLSAIVASFLAGIDFETTLLDGMLSFLLFAGALHVNWPSMARGTCTMTANAEFNRFLGAHGIAAPSQDDTFGLIALDVRRELVDELARANYPTPSVEKLIELTAVEVTPG